MQQKPKDVLVKNGELPGVEEIIQMMMSSVWLIDTGVLDLKNFIIDIVKEDDFTPREIDMNKYFNKDK